MGHKQASYRQAKPMMQLPWEQLTTH